MPALTLGLPIVSSASTGIAPVPRTGPGRLLPGLLLCVGVTIAAIALEHAEAALFGRVWLEALVLAILLGAAVRTAWIPDARWRPGIEFGAKTLLEIAGCCSAPRSAPPPSWR